MKNTLKNKFDELKLSMILKYNLVKNDRFDGDDHWSKEFDGFSIHLHFEFEYQRSTKSYGVGISTRLDFSHKNVPIDLNCQNTYSGKNNFFNYFSKTDLDSVEDLFFNLDYYLDKVSKYQLDHSYGEAINRMNDAIKEADGSFARVEEIMSEFLDNNAKNSSLLSYIGIQDHYQRIKFYFG